MNLLPSIDEREVRVGGHACLYMSVWGGAGWVGGWVVFPACAGALYNSVLLAETHQYAAPWLLPPLPPLAPPLPYARAHTHHHPLALPAPAWQVSEGQLIQTLRKEVEGIEQVG